MFRLLLFSSILITLMCCSGNSTDSRSTESPKVTAADSVHLEPGTFYPALTAANSQRRYSLYIPANYRSGQKLPLLLFLDPHADGRAPINNYRTLADQYGFLLLVSLDAKNGMTLPESGAIVGDLIAEANRLLPTAPSSVFLVGFSGGAKAALAASISTPGIASVIYCGAAFPPKTLSTEIPSLAMTGLRDMNFSEVLYYTAALDTLAFRHSLVVSENDHRWPTTREFEPAILWCMTNRCKSGAICDTTGIKKLTQSYLASIQQETDPVMKDFKLRHLVACTDGILPTESNLQLLMQNKNSVGFDQRLRQFTDELTYEQQVKKELQESFQSKDLIWWSNRIRRLRSTTGTVNDRLLGFVSLGAYLYSRNAVDQLKTDQSGHYIDIYRMADPKNPEWAFLSACRSMQLGETTVAMTSLNTAVQLGFDDAEKLVQEKTLTGLQQEPAFQSLVAKLRQ